MYPIKPVILFKSPVESESISTDPYITALGNRGFGPVAIIPVIQHIHVNLDQLKNVISEGPVGKYGGVIVTSGRAAESWKLAAQQLILEGVVDQGKSWSSTPFYVVGPRTASVFSSVSSDLQYACPAPSSIFGSEESGNAGKLAQFLVPHYRTLGHDPSLPILYLVGDKNQDTITKHLSESSILVHELPVYQTTVRGGAEIFQELANFQGTLLGGRQYSTAWLVFFAPSAAEAAIPICQLFFRLPKSQLLANAVDQTKPLVRIAAIGPTTFSYLTQSHPSQFCVDVTSPSPNAESLATALARFHATSAAEIK